MDLLQLLNQNQNDLNPLPRYASEDSNKEQDMDSIDLQSDVLSQALHDSLPVELFEEADPSFTEPEATPDAIFDVDEGNELSDYYTRHQEPSLGSMRGKQVPTRIRLPTWGHADNSDGDDSPVEGPAGDSDVRLARLIRLYEQLLHSSRD